MNQQTNFDEYLEKHRMRLDHALDHSSLNLEIISFKIIEGPKELIELDIIDSRRLGKHWNNAWDMFEAISASLSFNALAFKFKVNDYYSAPIRDDFPGWQHSGRHEEEGRDFWNWFKWKFPQSTVVFGDEPDLYGSFDKKKKNVWHGDIGEVSPMSFLDVMKCSIPGATWMTIQGNVHVIIEVLNFERITHDHHHITTTHRH